LGEARAGFPGPRVEQESARGLRAQGMRSGIRDAERIHGDGSM